MKKLLLSILCIVALFTGNTYAQCKDSVKVTGKAVTCNGLMDGEAVAYPAGGTAPYAYDWSTSPAQSTKIATNLGGGTYTVTILDAKGCSATRSVTIADPAAVTVTGTVKNASCFGSKNGSINALVKGGTTPYTYSWSTTPTQTGKTATGLAAGIYSLTVTDKNGCSAQLFDTVKQPNIIVLSTSSTASSCNTATGIAVVTVTSGGTAPFSYSWNTATAQTKDTINPAAAGQYIVTVTDANTCKSTATVTVGNTSGLSVAIASTNVTCYGAGNGTATATASGGKSPYTYSWSNASTSASLTSLTYGTYSVTVTDNSGCITSNSVKILVPAALSSTKLITNPT